MIDIELQESTCVHGRRLADCNACWLFLSMHMAPFFKRFDEVRAQRDRAEYFRDQYHGQIMQATGLLREEGQCVNSLFSMVQRIIGEKHDLQSALAEARETLDAIARKGDTPTATERSIAMPKGPGE